MADAHLNHAYAVVLAGGSGTRLWPVSRDNTPKQFLKLGGNRTMLQRTVDRILPLIPWERVIVITNHRYHEAVREQLPEIPEENIIAEPEKRDTALAMAFGALIAQHRDPDAVVVNIASDHVLKDEEEYRRVITAAVELASKQQHLLTVGITPTGPNVNFGYIKVDGVIENVHNYNVKKVLSFKEKPDLETAKSFLAEGDYFWNASMYTWHVNTIMAAFQQHYSEIVPGIERIRAAFDTPEFEQVVAEVYQTAPKQPIDIAISEKVDNLVLLPGDFGWDDIGLWSTVYELGEKDETGSVIVRDNQDISPVLQIASKNNLLSTKDRMIAMIGVEDLVVIDSNDVLLILPRSRAAEVKNVVQMLKDDGYEDYL